MNKFLRNIASTLCVLALSANTIIAQNPYPTPETDLNTNPVVYMLESETDLQWFAYETSHTNGGNINARLVSDITYTKKPFSSEVNVPYTGTFDGNNYELTLDVEISGDDYAALFEYVGAATFKNLRLKGTIKSNAQYSSTLAGKVVGQAKVENCISAVNVITKFKTADQDEYDAGFFAYIDNEGRGFQIKNSAYIGSAQEAEGTGGNANTYMCGLVGKCVTQGQGEISNVYVYCNEVSFACANAKLNPVGYMVNASKVWDNTLPKATITNFFYLAPTEHKDILESINNSNVKSASVDGFAGSFNETEKTKVEPITYSQYSELQAKYTITSRTGTTIDPAFYQTYKIADHWYSDPERTVVDDLNGDYSYLTYLKESDYNVCANFDNELVWKQGTKYPVLKSSSSNILKSALDSDGDGYINWSDVANWTGNINNNVPDYTEDVTIGDGDTNNKSVLVENIQAKARTLTIESGSSLTVKGTGFCDPNNIIVKGNLIVEGKSTLRTRSLKIEGGTVTFKYDYENSAPSFICHTGDIDNVTIERKFLSNFDAHVGASTYNCAKKSITGWMMESYFDPSTGWSDLFYTNETINNGACAFAKPDYATTNAANLALGRFFSISDSEDNGKAQTLIEEGKPASVHDVFKMDTSTKFKGTTVVFNNPYPFTVDLRTDSPKANSAIWKERNKTSYNFNVYNYGSGVTNGVDRTNDPYVAPFKTVTYKLKDGVNEFVLPSTPAGQANAQLSKSASVRDDFFKIAIAVDGEELSQAVALAFMSHGTMDADIVNVDSEFSYDKINDVQMSTQILVRKPSSSSDLSIAVFPTVSNLVNIEIPLVIVPVDGGISSSLTITSVNTYYFNDGYEVYLHDKLKGTFYNMSQNSNYEVEDIDQLTDRFGIVIVNVGEEPNPSTATGMDDDDDDQPAPDFNVATEGKKIIVNKVAPESVGETITLYNITGQVESTAVAETGSNVLEAQSEGIHAVTLNGKGKVIVVNK